MLVEQPQRNGETNMTLGKFEKLSTALTAFLRTYEARDESRLFDAALAAGMPHDTNDLIEWASIQVANHLFSGEMA